MKRIEGFPPIIDKQTKIIILGTFPGCDSLLFKEYYANPRNQFWSIMKAVIPNFDDSTYKSKINSLLKNRIGVWDLIRSCERNESSLDKHIKKPIFNDINAFLKERKIKQVFINGSSFKKILRENKMKELIVYDSENILQSSSSANAKHLEAKVKDWKRILDYI